MIDLTLSTPLFDAPSISIAEPSALFIFEINALAAVVLPHPEDPQNKYVFFIVCVSIC